MAFISEFDSVSTTSEYVCVCKSGLAFCAYEEWVVFPLVSLDVYAPCDFQGVSSSPVRCVGVCMDCVVRSRGSSLTYDLTLDGVGACRGARGVCSGEFA